MNKNNLNEDLENEELEVSSGNEAKGVNTFVQKNGKLIIILSIAVIVVVGLVILFKNNSEKNAASAAKALARTEEYYLKGEYENALHGNDTLPTVRGEKIIGLVDIINEYGSTAAGERATLYAGESFFALGKYPEAKKYYEKAIKSSIDVIKIGGLAGSAACNERDGKIKEAAEEYQKAAELILEDAMKMRYLYFAALCYEKSEDNEKAKEIYRNILNLNKFGEYNNLAKAGIVRLGDVIE
jgi:tetratricopeptide (TPR) repeat protein